MVPHGGYTVTNSPTRYAYPAPSHDIRSSRGAIFALKMANLGGLRNLLCLHLRSWSDLNAAVSKGGDAAQGRRAHVSRWCCRRRQELALFTMVSLSLNHTRSSACPVRVGSYSLVVRLPWQECVFFPQVRRTSFRGGVTVKQRVERRTVRPARPHSPMHRHRARSNPAQHPPAAHASPT
jgi:hypothetical protein